MRGTSNVEFWLIKETSHQLFHGHSPVYVHGVAWSSSQIRSPTWSQYCCIMTLHLFHSKVEVTIVSTRSIRKRCLSNIMFCTFCVFGNTFKYTCESSAKYGLDPIISLQLFFSFLAKITQGMVLLMHLMCNTKYISQTIPLHKCALNPKIGFVIYLVVFFYNCIWVQLKLDFGFWILEFVEWRSAWFNLRKYDMHIYSAYCTQPLSPSGDPTWSYFANKKVP